jgi:signal transduction histidine kinase
MKHLGFGALTSHTAGTLCREELMAHRHHPQSPRRPSAVRGAARAEAPSSESNTHPRHGSWHRRLARRRDLTPDERRLRDARRRAARKYGFIAHLVPYTMTCLFITAVAGFRAGMIVAFAWGIGVALHGFFALVSPDLRKRLLEAEVERSQREGDAESRRELEERHTRSLEELAAGVAHEIRNPVTAAKSLVQQMGEDPGSRENVTYARVALEELDRVERSISHLLRFARDEELRFAELELPENVQSALETLRERIAALGVRVRFERGRAGALRGDAEKLRRVWINLIGNALDALEESATREPELELTFGENLAGSELWLRVRDNGPGIPLELRRRIWSPFYTSKSSGTGLGLALAKKVIEGHGGPIELEANETAPRGASFLVTLPKHPPDSAGDAPSGGAST